MHGQRSVHHLELGAGVCWQYYLLNIYTENFEIIESIKIDMDEYPIFNFSPQFWWTGKFCEVIERRTSFIREIFNIQSRWISLFLYNDDSMNSVAYVIA